MRPAWRGWSAWRGKQVVPGWAILDLPWRDAEFAVVDLETTGLDLRKDAIVSYGAVVVREGRVHVSTALYGIVRPDRPVSAASIAVHGLRSEDLAQAPPLSECADRLIGALSGRVLVAHAAWVETAFIGRAFRGRGVRLAGPTVDTAALARHAGLARSLGEGGAEPGLEALAERLGLPVHTPHHALGDALTTAGIFVALASRLDARESQTVRSLAATSRSHSRTHAP